MKKTTILSLVLCIAVLAALAIPTGNASILSSNWISPAVKSQTNDPYYNALITAYAENTQATLVVNVNNNLGGTTQLNVSAVKVGFDWGINYSSTECSMATPLTIPTAQSRVFSVTFTVPSIQVASNKVTHTYTIYVESVNGTSESDIKVIVPSASWTSSPAINFVVFSTDQATANEELKQLNALQANTGILPIFTAHGRQLQQQSGASTDQGDASYRQGDFASAATSYTNALALLQQAWGNETSTWTSGENSLISMVQGGASMLTLEGYAILIVSIGFLLMGIGVIVFLMRKSKQPPMPHP